MSYHVFISYPRIADERGAVTDIRAHLERELRIKTGDRDLVVFQDRSGMTGGDPWSEILEEELKKAGVFLLLLCPLWLTSDWCRKELSLYRALGKQQGVERPILPLLWDKTEPRNAQSEEQVAMLAWIKTHLLIEWNTLRHRDSSYQGYREAIGNLAEAVAERLLGK